MDPIDFMNLSGRGASLWIRFITVLRVPRHVAACDWLGYLFFILIFLKKNQTKKKYNNNQLCCFGNQPPSSLPSQVSLMGMLLNHLQPTHIFYLYIFL